MDKKQIGIGILGGTGYGAGELLRILIDHPEADVVSVVSSSSAGKGVEGKHIFLSGFYPKNFDSELNYEELLKYSRRFIVAALPHGTSANAIRALLPLLKEKKISLIDLSGDLRLDDSTMRQIYYPEAAVDQEFKEQFIYGLPELHRSKIAKAQFIANPGCLASSAILAAAPIVKEVAGQIFFDAKTGSSGAGRTPQPAFHHPQLHANSFAYKLLEHRHEPEIAQELSLIKGVTVQTSFVPHVIPVSRGIYLTAQGILKREIATGELKDLYCNFYADSPFIRVRDHVVQLEHVVGSNFCDIYVKARGLQFVVVAALDNLIKGMVGQAVQNMNLMCGLPEKTGLWSPSLGPI